MTFWLWQTSETLVIPKVLSERCHRPTHLVQLPHGLFWHYHSPISSLPQVYDQIVTTEEGYEEGCATLPRLQLIPRNQQGLQEWLVTSCDVPSRIPLRKDLVGQLLGVPFKDCLSYRAVLAAKSHTAQHYAPS